MRNNYTFCEYLGIFTNEKLVKIICENLASENKNERLLGLEILLNLSKSPNGAKSIIEKINFRDIYNFLEKDKSEPLQEAIITLTLNLTQHKKDLQERIMEYPSILQLFVYFFEKALGNIKDVKLVFLIIYRNIRIKKLFSTWLNF